MSPKKTSASPIGYEKQYDRELKKILRRHAADDLFNEIELIRYMNLLVLQQMKVAGKKLSYRDYLETLRAITGAAGRIAHLTDIQYRLFKPLIEMETAHKTEMDATYQRILEIAQILMGGKKVGTIEMEALMQVMNNENRSES
jgi:hypothetical protein